MNDDDMLLAEYSEPVPGSIQEEEEETSTEPIGTPPTEDENIEDTSVTNETVSNQEPIVTEETNKGKLASGPVVEYDDQGLIVSIDGFKINQKLLRENNGYWQYQYTDGLPDPGKRVTDPVKRFTGNIPGVGHFDRLIDGMAQGVEDFAFDAAGGAGKLFDLGWLRKADQWYDANNPASRDPFHTLVRDVSAVVIPSLVANKVVVGGLANATSAKNISTVNRTLASILAQMGIETGIAGITSQSYEQDNAAGALNKLLGWNIPWATEDGMDPEKRRHLHMYEAAGMSAAVDLIGAIGAFGQALKRINLDEKSLRQLTVQNDRLRAIIAADGSDVVTDVIEGTRGARELAKKDEALTRIAKKGGNLSEYDPFINNPARPEQRAIPADEIEFPDPVGAKADQFIIQKNINTTDGVMRTVAGKPIMDSVMNSFDGSKRGKALGEFYNRELSANSDVIVKNLKISANELNAAVDNLVEQLFNPNVSFKDFQNIVNGGKTMTFSGRKFLSEQRWVEAQQAWKLAHDAIFNPDNLRASAMMTQQAASTVSTTARSLELLQGIGTNSRQWEIMSKKMKFLVGEVTTNQDIVARSQTLKKLISEGDFHKTATWLNDQLDSFDSGIAASKRKAYDVINEIERIAKENPEYIRPLAEAYDATNGDINTLYKLHKWAENNIGLLKKGIYDRNPEMPSFIIKGLHGIRYNSILNGLSPIRAAVGNSTMAVIKPISVFTGAFAQGDVGTFKKALYTYGGLIENFKRGFKVMGDDWRLANSNPEVAVKHGRHDIKFADMDKFEVMQSMSDAWRRDGKDGKVALWNIGASLTHWNNWKYNRWGVNGLYSIDGFFKSLMASGSARAKAYDALFEATNGSFNKQQFLDLQQHLYNQAFDSNGLLRDQAAKFASDELALTLDYKAVEHFESFLNHVPAAKALFMFPNTGMNAFELTWSFNPVSNIGPAITRARRTLGATTPEQIAEVLAEHGLDNTVSNLKTLQSEYLGRQLMGAGVIMGAGIWALEGNLTGNGPQDGAERRRMMNMGWKPLSMRHPVTGEWRSYKGLEPFESILGLTADFVYQSERVDQSISEDWFRKLVAGITMNVGNQTFTAGFEPLASLYSGNPGAWSRFWASQVNTFAPQAGVRSILNNIISPQLRDVKYEFTEQLANLNKFMIPGNSKFLPDMVDIYTGDPIRFHEPMTAAANSLLPFFKQNGGTEPWRQWLLSTGWDGLSQKRRDEIAEEPLTPHARQYINNWIGKHGGLRERVIEIMNMTDDQWKSEIRKYKKNLGRTGLQSDFPIKKTILYELLNDAHSDVFRYALSNYHQYLRDNDPNKVTRGYMRRIIKGQLQTGDTEGAGKTKQQLLNYK